MAYGVVILSYCEYMMNKIITIHGVIEVWLNNFNDNFFQGADFFKKTMSGGSLSGRDFCGSDFRKSNLTNIDLSSISCGFSFVRIVVLIGCVLFSTYVAVNLSSLHDSVAGAELNSQEIDSIIENLSLKVLFLLSFAFSVYYAAISSYVYNFLESKVVAIGIDIKEKFINGYMKTFTIFLKIIYIQCFGTAISATAILFLDAGDTASTLKSFLRPIDEYHKEIALYLLLFKVLNLLLFIILGLYLPSLFSTSMILFETSFEKSIMNNVNLSNAFGNRVNFKHSKMNIVNFKGASLRFANFYGVNFETVDFEDADLTCCNFTESNVEDL
ncbi:pentapeptide repeat-containing protein, partial [Chamaesiphon polymorphus]